METLKGHSFLIVFVLRLDALDFLIGPREHQKYTRAVFLGVRTPSTLYCSAFVPLMASP